MYANTGIATDSARTGRSTRWARWLAKPCRRLFVADPAPDLQNAARHGAHVAASQRVSGVDGVAVQIIRGGQPTRHID
jgi:hypothetical protein